MADDERAVVGKDEAQRAILWILLAINAGMFLVELLAGVLAQSTGLIGDSLDMFADAAVYAISLFAVGRSLRVKASAALLSGILQVLLALVVLVDVGRRFLFGSDPLSAVMIIVGTLALAANTAALLIIQGHREGEVHMRASWIFTQNDVIVNLGIILGGVLVDGVFAISDSYLAAFGTVFGLEIVAAIVGLGLLSRISVSAFLSTEPREVETGYAPAA